MKRLIQLAFFLCILTFTFDFCSAQGSGIRELDNEDLEEMGKAKDKIRIGVTPSALLNNYIGIQFNSAITMNHLMQFNLEGGWIVSSSAFNNENTTGYRFRPSLKFYVNKEEDYRLHLSLGYHLRYSKADRVSSFIASDGTFLGMLPYKQEREVSGLAVLFGVDHWLSDRIVLDAGLGFGVGTLNIVDIDAPSEAIKDTFIFENDDPGTSRYPILILNIKFQYILI